jgi:hypothetical protein
MNDKVRYISYRGTWDEKEAKRVRENRLLQIGDIILVWCNQGDLCRLGEDQTTLWDGKM